MKTLLSGYLLSSQKGDRMSMANSVEVRYPFLDNNVVDLFSTMPDDIKLNNMIEKFILFRPLKTIYQKNEYRSKQPYLVLNGTALAYLAQIFTNPVLKQ